MKAAVVCANEDVQYLDYEEPIPGPGEVKVSKPKWVVRQKWFSSLSSCLFWMSQQLVAKQQDVFDIKTYLQEMKKIEEVFRLHYDN